MKGLNKKIEEDFIRLVNGEKLFHAYLFFGENQDEIFEFSRKLAYFFENNEFKKPDNFLNNFLAIKPNENGNIGIDEIRALQDFLYLSAIGKTKNRIAVIYGAENLTNEAQSAILKIIEEPPQKSLIILIARQQDNLLPTLVSRTHRIYFPAVRWSAGAELDGKNKNKPITNNEDVDVFFNSVIIDLGKNLRQNFKTAKEILDRLALIRQYNLNVKLQLRLLNFYLSGSGLAANVSKKFAAGGSKKLSINKKQPIKKSPK